MLKLTMNPRKRSKRLRNYYSKARVQASSDAMSTEAKAMEQKEMLVDNLQVLLRQESSGQYACVDYLSMNVWQRNVYDFLKRSRVAVPQQGDSRIDEFCREQIVEWSFRVVDYFRIDREVVSLSLSFLDRFLATCQCDRSTFKLAATTTLNLAVKLLHPCKLGDLGILSDLSRGEFDMQDVAEMEAHVLHSLTWNLSPPSAIAFSALLLDYIFCTRDMTMSAADIDDLHDISAFFTELAVCDYFFVTMRPSAVALACILNALEGMFGQENEYSTSILGTARTLNFCTHEDLTAACHKLWELYERSEECALHNNFEPMEEEITPMNDAIFVKKAEDASTSSPVTVASSKTPNEFMCAMRSRSLRNGSW